MLQRLTPAPIPASGSRAAASRSRSGTTPARLCSTRFRLDTALLVGALLPGCTDGDIEASGRGRIRLNAGLAEGEVEGEIRYRSKDEAEDMAKAKAEDLKRAEKPKRCKTKVAVVTSERDMATGGYKVEHRCTAYEH